MAFKVNRRYIKNFVEVQFKHSVHIKADDADVEWITKQTIEAMEEVVFLCPSTNNVGIEISTFKPPTIVPPGATILTNSWRGSMGSIAVQVLFSANTNGAQTYVAYMPCRNPFEEEMLIVGPELETEIMCSCDIKELWSWGCKCGAAE